MINSVSIFSQPIWMKFSELPQPAGLLKLMFFFFLFLFGGGGGVCTLFRGENSIDVIF